MKTTTFAKRLTEALIIRNLSAAEFSRRMGISEAVISQYRSGKYEPKQDRLDEFARALDVSEGWLMGYDVPMERQNRAEKSSDEAHESMDPKTAEFIRIWNKFTDEEKDAVISFMRAFKKTPPSENDGV